ncbi:acyltransferase domain-containing protein, partial [Micromonospora sp. CPCC 205371]|nr:acyltransferase domain-containing protein [Micromonospora sp. CPCC 205371]
CGPNGAPRAAVIGPSMGEVPAAVVSGALTPAGGMRVIARRAELLARLGPGAMSVLGIGEDDFGAFAADLSNVHIAVVSGPHQIVVTGPEEEVAAVAARVAAEGRLARTLTTEGAGHSPAVDPLLPPLAEALAELRPVRPSIPFYSTVVDDPRAVPALSAPYWTANLRRPVHLARAVAAAADDGHRFFLEISPHPMLVRSVRATLEARGVPDALVTGTLRRDGGASSFARQLATLYAHGLPAPPLARGVVLGLPPAPWPRGRPRYHKAGSDAPPALRGLRGLTWAEMPLSAATGDAAPARQPLPASVPAPAVPGPVHLFAAAAEGVDPARAAEPPVEGAAPGGGHPPAGGPAGGAPLPLRGAAAP